jgi:hypothetical protein
MVKVIQWGAGKNGSALIRAIVAHADLELVGCKVFAAAKNGIDAGTLAGLEPLGVAATTDTKALIDLDADVVLHCPALYPDMTGNDADICELLRSGKNVISVSGAHSMPQAIPGYAEQFERACRDGGSTFAAGGVNPGFVAERLAPTLTGLCADVDEITIRETYQCQQGGEDLLFRAMQFGVPLEQWSPDSPVGRMFDHLFTQLIHATASPLGVELKEVRRIVEVAPMTADAAIAGRLVRAGTVGGIGQTWEGVPRDPGQIIIRKATRWVISDDIPGWAPFSGWRIEIAGKPSLRLDLQIDPEGDRTYEPECMVGGAIPMIEEVLRAPPGLLRPSIFAPFKRRIDLAR